jgi:hypothetical protein
LTVRVVVQAPPGARAHGFGLVAERVDGFTKLVVVPVSDGIESTKVELVQDVPVSLLVTVAVYVTVPPGVTVAEIGLRVTVGAALVHATAATEVVTVPLPNRAL